MNEKLLFRKLVLFIFLLVSSLVVGQTQADIEKIRASYNLPKLKQLETEFSIRYAKDRKFALEYAKKKNIPILITKDSSYQELQRIEPDGTPIYYKSHNANCAISTRTNHLNSEGSLGLNLDGQDMTVYLWDGVHPRVTHVDFDSAEGETNRATIEDAVSEGGVFVGWHATHVAGTLIGTGFSEIKATGMARRAQCKAYKTGNTLAEVAAAAANGMLFSNHSYGLNNDIVPQYFFGCYTQDVADWDNVLFNAPYYLMITSAGNVHYNQWDELTWIQVIKNNLVVASMNDASVDALGNLNSDPGISNLSNPGPTDELRIKPDIAANGVVVQSTGSHDDYGSNTLTGTSMAAPNVTGSLLLVQQHYKNLNGNFMKAATVKGLALHTADDVNRVGPDEWTGWGLLNAKKAVETITRNGKKSIVNELTLTQGQTYSITVTSDNINKLMASISWTDAPGIPTTVLNSPLSRLTNDLDIRITKATTTFFPYKLISVSTNGFGDNTVDPFERIEVANATGLYTITVSHKGTLASGSQSFSLIVTGISNNCSVSVPTDISYRDVNTNSAIIQWKNVEDSFFQIRYRVQNTANWTIVSTSELGIKLTGLTPLTNYEVQVQNICPSGLTSGFSPSTFFTTQGTYCTSIPTSGQSGNIRNLLNFELNAFNNYSSMTNIPYENYTNLRTDLVKGETNTLKVTPQSGSNGVTIWIDYNRNGLFTDAGEQVFNQASTSANPINGSFIVPSNALEGGTRLRVAMRENGSPISCSSSFAGQVEDYTVIIKNTSCSGQTTWNGSAWSNGVPNTNLEAIINGNYSGNGFACCKLSITGTAQVNIPSGQNLIVDEQVNVASTASLTLQSNANLVQYRNVANSGNIKIKRSTAPLKRLDYSLWSSPVANQNLQAFSPQTLSNRFYTYNTATNFYNTINPATNAFSNGLGYLIRMPNNHPTTPTVWTGEFNGVPNNGAITINAPTGYVAIGNPYPSELDLSPFLLENELYYDGVYFWRKENSVVNSSYATYVFGFGGISNSGDPNKIIPSRYVAVGQAFIVYNVLPSIKFKNSMRIARNRNIFLRTAQEETPDDVHRMYLHLANNSGITSNLMIGYAQNATVGIDPLYEARYINDSPNALTSLINGEEFTIQGRGLPFDVTDAVPLGFKTELAGNYSISIVKADGIFGEGQHIYLEDLATNTIHPLYSSEYNFTTEAGVFNNRFKIKYQNSSLGIDDNHNSNTTIYFSNNFLNIISKKEIEHFSVFDMMGRLLLSEKNSNSLTVKKELEGIAKQALIVKVTLIDGQIITGKIIN